LNPSLKSCLALLPLVAALVVALPTLARAEGYHLLRQWGSRGVGDGQFKGPVALAVAAAGPVYVVDQDNNRILKFTREGEFVAQWGGPGAEAGQFDYPSGVAVDAAGHVFVADTENCRVQEFTGEGVFVRQWGSAGAGEGQFGRDEDTGGGGLTAIATDGQGFVYTLDKQLNRVQKFTVEGSFVTQWGSEGAEPGQFDIPGGVAVDAAGNVFVADTFNYRIQKFTSAGEYVAHWGGKGEAPEQLLGPTALALDAAGNVYVAESNADDFITGEADLLNRVAKFTAAGEFLAQWGVGGQEGDAPDQLMLPQGLAVDAAGNVYVADTSHDRVVVYAPD
jgi:DNA-binding beta-propeller fold protein YncE